ncbi:zinc finger C2HC domain-containing protein 1A [Scyliorhinus torazame]|uniref:zinc finger C2HC domain-containing protein 1A n=1 Tax=Scyliorhinus torazame TaxID=75743 RepID=UPI003B5B8A04
MEAVPVVEGVATEGNLAPCRTCGRTFLPAVRVKHEPICQKSAHKRRKAFDSSRQRAEGTDISIIKPLKPKLEPPKKPSNWRMKHENFIATIRAAKKINQTMKVGGALPPPPPPLYDPDYVQCPYCQRRFNENAADRHVSFCKEQAARIAKSKPGIKGKLTTTTQYKSPVHKKTNSPVSTPGVTTRIPQPSVGGKNVAGFSTTKSNLPTTYENKLRDGSPAKRSSSSVGNVPGALIQPTGSLSSNIRPRTHTPPSGIRNVAATISVNKKTYNAENYIRNSVKSGLDTSDGITVRSSASQQLSRFCHECGTKYPVECAKFCCECGVRRVTL